MLAQVREKNESERTLVLEGHVVTFLKRYMYTEMRAPQYRVSLSIFQILTSSGLIREALLYTNSTLYIAHGYRSHVCDPLHVPSEKKRHLFSEIALNSLLQLLKKEVAENSRHLNQYFQVFLNYANRGVAEVRYSLTIDTQSSSTLCGNCHVIAGLPLQC